MSRSTNLPIIGSPDHPIARSLMFWRLWWRAVSVKRSQAALALVSLAVGAAITSMLLSLYGGVRRKMTEDFRSYGANVVIAPGTTESSVGGESGGVMEDASLQPLAVFTRQTPGTVFAPLLYGVVQVSPDRADPRLQEFANVVAVGADFGLLRSLNPGWRETGKVISSDQPAGECVVGSQLAAQFHLRPGDSLHLRRVIAEPAHGAEKEDPSPGSMGGRLAPKGEDAQAERPPVATFRIATVLTSGASEDNQVFVPLAALQSLLGLPGKISLAELSIPGETGDVERAVRRLTQLLPGVEVRPIRQIVYSEGKVLGTIRWLLLSLTILILVIIALCVMATMTAIVLDRRKDIGMMKALGAADALLMRLFMTEGASLGLVGGALGFGVGALAARGVARQLFGIPLSPNAGTLPLVCVLSMALALLAAQVPLRIIRAIQPAVVLKGE
ncbi:MAG TPA: FtsX-like permease family protein [Terriglobia bacterium]|nr:FtsX-like permease family protein [Terriglobia bacterium]